jgi:predicted permease
MFKDLRYAFRKLRHTPGFALTAILSIGLAIGANSSIFSLQDGLLLRPLPIERPSEVVSITARPQSGGVESFSYPEFAELREKTRSFDGILGYELVGTAVARDNRTQPVFRIGYLVSGNFFDVVGVKPALGRTFRPDEDAVSGRDAVAVVSYEFWKNELGSDRSVIGSHLRMRPGAGQDFTVIGVAPESFTGMDLFFRPTFFIPTMMGPMITGKADRLTDRAHISGNMVNLRGRLKQGVSVEAANAEIVALAKGLESEYPDTNRGRGAAVRTELQTRVDYAPILGGIVAAVLGMMIVILVIACANVTNLMLGRGRARAREISVRLAIGAGRTRLVRQLFAESLLISLAGGAIGLFIAGGALQVFRTFEVPGDFPVRLSFELDSRVLVFTLSVSVLSAILFGLIPAWRSTRTDLITALKAGDLDNSRKRFFGRNALVTVQIAGSLLMLMTAAQLYRNTTKVLTDNPGFLRDHRLTVKLDTSLANYTTAQSEQFYRALIDRVKGLAEIKSAALSVGLPLSTDNLAFAIVPEGYQFREGQRSVRLGGTNVDENYFTTLNVPILVGRGFRSSDTADSPRVAVVNQEFAMRYFRGEAVGKRIRIDNTNDWTEVVGVTMTGKYGGITESPQPYVYFPIHQKSSLRLTLTVETAASPEAMAGPVRDIIRSIDPNMPVLQIRTLDDMFDHGPVTQIRIFNVVFGVPAQWDSLSR